MLNFVLLCLIMLYLANASKWSSLEKIFNKPIFRKFIHILRICVFHIIHILHSISTQISKFFQCRSRYFSRILRRKEGMLQTYKLFWDVRIFLQIRKKHWKQFGHLKNFYSTSTNSFLKKRTKIQTFMYILPKQYPYEVSWIRLNYKFSSAPK